MDDKLPSGDIRKAASAPVQPSRKKKWSAPALVLLLTGRTHGGAFSGPGEVFPTYHPTS